MIIYKNVRKVPKDSIDSIVCLVNDRRQVPLACAVRFTHSYLHRSLPPTFAQHAVWNHQFKAELVSWHPSACKIFLFRTPEAVRASSSVIPVRITSCYQVSESVSYSSKTGINLSCPKARIGESLHHEESYHLSTPQRRCLTLIRFQSCKRRPDVQRFIVSDILIQNG